MLAIQISGLGTLMTGINFITTILKMRAPGMTLMKMPMFTWSALVTNVIIVFAFPVLTVSLINGNHGSTIWNPLLYNDKWRYGYALGEPLLGLGTS